MSKPPLRGNPLQDTQRLKVKTSWRLLPLKKQGPLDEKQQFEARCQFVADKQKSKLLSEQRTVHSVEEPPAFYDSRRGASFTVKDGYAEAQRFQREETVCRERS